MDWMIMPLRRYADFTGRSRRKEYWMYFLFVLICTFVLNLLDMAAGLNTSGRGVLSSIFSLATLVPSLAVGVRRLHDTDRSGWWILVPLGAAIPGLLLMTVSLSLGITIFSLGLIVGSIAILVFMCLDGTRGDNRFGPDPKGPNLTEVFA